MTAAAARMTINHPSAPCKTVGPKDTTLGAPVAAAATTAVDNEGFFLYFNVLLFPVVATATTVVAAVDKGIFIFYFLLL